MKIITTGIYTFEMYSTNDNYHSEEKIDRAIAYSGVLRSARNIFAGELPQHALQRKVGEQAILWIHSSLFMCHSFVIDSSSSQNAWVTQHFNTH